MVMRPARIGLLGWGMVVVAALAPDATAQCERARLLADDVELRDRFGSAIALDGDWLAIGASHDDDVATNTGAVYLYQRDGLDWVEYAKLTPDTPNGPNELFGSTIALEGTRLVVGAPESAVATTDGAGVVYVFDLFDDVWTQQARIINPDAAEDDRFGSALAVSGDTIAIGAAFDNDPDNESIANVGSVNIFTLVDDAWTRQETITLDVRTADDYFGCSVAIEGDTLVVGAWGQDEEGAQSGAVYIYTRAVDAWTLEHTLIPSELLSGDEFGFAVDLQGDLLAVGARQYAINRPGKAFIFRWDGVDWTQETTLTAATGGNRDEFGRQVRIAGPYLLVTAPYHDGAGLDAGAGFVFFDDGLAWTEHHRYTPLDAGPGLKLGLTAAAADGDYAALGSVHAADLGELTGIAYVEEMTLAGEDCNDNGIPDSCDIDLGLAQDCNDNGIPDSCDIANGLDTDCDGNGVPDGCELVDCNNNGIHDACDLLNGTSEDCNNNGIPDECDIINDPDCNGNGIIDACELIDNDCDGNGQPDDCQADFDGDGTPDVCEDPVIETVTLIGADVAWTDPTFGGMEDPPTVRITGYGLSADRIELRNDEYTVVVTDFTFMDPGGYELQFVLPPFPPGSHLDGDLGVRLSVYATGGASTVPFAYQLLTYTVGDGGDFATLTEAVAAAHDGSAIIVPPGTYIVPDTLVFADLSCFTFGAVGPHPNLQVTDNVTDIIRIENVDETVRIMGLDLTAGGSAITVDLGATPIIADCFIKDAQKAIDVVGGSAPIIDACIIGPADTSPAQSGNAISITDNSTATIQNCTIVQCYGAALGPIHASYTSETVVIRNNSILFNEAIHGGAIYIGDNAEARVVGNLLESNTALASGGQGGAIYVAAQVPGEQITVEIMGNRIIANTALGNAQCSTGVPAGGGGIFVGQYAAPRIVDNFIVQNEAAVGGAIAVCRGATPLIHRNVIVCNSVTVRDDDPDYFAPGVFIYDAEPRVLNNIFYRNDVIVPVGDEPVLPTLAESERGGGVHGSQLASAGTVFANNVFYENDGYGLYFDSVISRTFVDVLHNDFWNNDQPWLCTFCEATTPTLYPGRTFGNVEIHPTLVQDPPDCADRDSFALDPASPLIALGLADDELTFIDDRYDLYHPLVTTPIGWLDRDGILSPGLEPLILEATEIGSRAAVATEELATGATAISIASREVIDVLDDTSIFKLHPDVPGNPATSAVRITLDPVPVGVTTLDLELPWSPPVDADNALRLLADTDDDGLFETLLAQTGVIDPVERIVRYEDVAVDDFDGVWIIGASGLDPGPLPCPADLDDDRDVDISDLGILLASFEIDGGGDTDGDGDTDIADLGTLLASFGLPCP
jgi:hypothetical protein